MDSASSRREEDSSTSLLGQTLDPAYRLVALLDTGGRCDVYRAWDHSGDRYVAVKVIRRGCDSGVLERFAANARALCCEGIPHVVPILSHGIHRDRPYVVLPYVAGGTLRQRRPTENNRPLLAHPALLYTWLPRIAAALDSLHEHGLFHGAVSPDTILFDEAGEAWLTESVLGAQVDTPRDDTACQSDSPAIRGRLACQSPQLFQGAAASRESDQYALAAVAFDYLAGQPPFPGDTAEAIVAQQKTKDAPPLQDISPNLPSSLVVAIHRALAYDPAVRFATCGDFVSRALAHVAAIGVPCMVRLLCPECQVLVAVTPEAAGRKGRCQTCQAEIEIDADLRWLARDSDRRADIPVPHAPPPPHTQPDHRLPAALAALVGTLALVLWAIRRPEPPPAGERVAAVALQPAAIEPNVDAVDDRAPIAPPEPSEEPAPESPLAGPAMAAAVVPPAQAPPDHMQPDAAMPAEPATDAAQAVVVPPPVIIPRPAARDLALAALARDLESLHTSRKTLVASRDSIQRTILEHQTTLKALRSDEAAKRQRLTEQQILFQSLSIQSVVLPSPAVLRQLAAVDGEINLLRTQLLGFDDARSGAMSALASAERELASVRQSGALLRENWIARLSPLERDATLDTRIRSLSDEIASSPDFPECRLYRALLHVLAGNVGDARDDLAIVDRTLIHGDEAVASSTAIDFVYASLMVGDGTAARGCLAVAQRKIPNDPVLQHIQALCEIAEDDFSKAAVLFRAALQKTSRGGTRRDRTLLCSDAAWLFAAAPSDLVRNENLARQLATEAIDSRSGKAWQAWRARAALQAEEGQWAEAEESVLNAQKTAPLVLAEEIAGQMETVKNRETYRIPRRQR